MKFNTTKLRLLYIQRSIKSISRFHELWGSIPDLNWSAEVSLLVSSPVRSQQRFFDAYVSEWMKNRGSIVLDVAQIRNCHGWCNLIQFQNVHENGEFLLAEGPTTLVDGESMKNNARFMQNLDEKLREKVCEKMQNGSRSEILMC